MTTHIPSDNTSPDNDDVVVQFPGAAQPATDPAPAPEPDIFAEDALDAITPTEQEDYLIPVDMWPQPVDGAQLLTEIADTFNRHAILPEGGAETAAVFAVASWCVHACRWRYAPRLFVESGEGVWDSGKTAVMSMFLYMVRRPTAGSGMTESSLFRTMDAHHPTIVLDEADQILPTRGAKGLTKVLNSGFDRMLAKVRLNEYDTTAKKWKPREYSTFGMAILGGIGKFAAPQLRSRGPTIYMEPKMPDEKIEPFDPVVFADQREDLRALRAKMMRFAYDNRQQLTECRPSLPREIANNRIGDVASVLLRPADVAGGDWPIRARRALTKVLLRHQPVSDNKLLLHHIAELLADPFIRVGEKRQALGPEFLYSEYLVEALRVREDWPYEKLSKHGLRHMLSPLGIPAPEQEGGNSKVGKPNWRGYRRAWFETAFIRHGVTAPAPKAAEPLEADPQTATPAPITETAEPLDPDARG